MDGMDNMKLMQSAEPMEIEPTMDIDPEEVLMDVEPRIDIHTFKDLPMEDVTPSTPVPTANADPFEGEAAPPLAPRKILAARAKTRRPFGRPARGRDEPPPNIVNSDPAHPPKPSLYPDYYDGPVGTILLTTSCILR